MVRHRVFLLTIVGFVLVSLACNAFAGTSEPSVPPLPTFAESEPTQTASAIGAAPTATLASAVTPIGTETPTGPQVQALVDLNVRTGPGVAYSTNSFLLEGETAVIIGKDPDGSWWKIACPARAETAQCWVSGKAQYTAVSNTESVPVAEIPATPTPEPESLGPVAVYLENRRLMILPLDVAKDPPAAGAPRPIGERSDVQALQISPDGRKIAYRAGIFPAGDLRVINVDGSDDRALVAATDLPLPPGRDAATYVVTVDQFQWTADSQRLVFNTQLTPYEGITLGNQADLWRVGMDGTPTQVFAPGEGGAVFAVSPVDQVIMSQATAIVRANLDGSGRETLVQFELVNTASEYIYYPIPQWTTDGSRAFTAVPSREPFSPEAVATLWQLPSTGTAVQLGTLPGNILFNPVAWSYNGAQLAYVRQLISSANVEPVLMVGSTNGQDVGAYNSAEQIAFFDWSPDNTHFLYTTGQFYAVGQASSGPMTISIPAGQHVQKGQWLNESTFVIATGSDGSWTLSSGNVSGVTTPLTTFASRNGIFDVWGP